MSRSAPKSVPVSAGVPAGLVRPGFFGALMTAALIAYGPALGGSFLWDDHGHVTRSDLRSLDGLFRIWFEIGATQQYYPILHSAFWVEHRLWGDSPLGYHLLNVALHAIAAGQLWLVLRRLAVPGAAFASFLFLLHPVCVESVAWIAEQKNTLSTVFYLGAALAYLRFDEARRGSGAGRARPAYALASFLFVLALLTKTVTASLPAALLVVAWWRRGTLSFRQDVVPLLPWFAAGAAGGLFTAHFEKVLIGAQGASFDLGFVERLLLSGRIVWFYLGSLVWPANLMFVYPRWTVDAGSAGQWLFLLAALAALAGLAWWSRRNRGPLAAGLLFAGTLFPVLGFFDVYPFVFSYVADHFQYLASLSIFALAGAGFSRAASRLPAAGVRIPQAGLLAVLGALTWSQCGMYRDPTTLFETTLKRNPDAWMPHHNLAMILTGENRFAEAVHHLETVLRLKPDYAPAANNLGHNLIRLERFAEAVAVLQRAVELKPGYSLAHRNLGLALATLGRNAEALAHFQTANRLDPADHEAELNQGIALMLLDRFPEAVPHFERAIALAPDYTEHRFIYGRALAHQGRPHEAIAQFKATLELAPNYAEAHHELAQIYRQLGRQADAARHHQTAVQLNPALGGPR